MSQTFSLRRITTAGWAFMGAALFAGSVLVVAPVPAAAAPGDGLIDVLVFQSSGATPCDLTATLKGLTSPEAVDVLIWGVDELNSKSSPVLTLPAQTVPPGATSVSITISLTPSSSANRFQVDVSGFGPSSSSTPVFLVKSNHLKADCVLPG